MISFIDSGVGLVLSMVRLSSSIEHQKQVYNYKASNVGVVYDEQMHSLANHLRGKAAELCLANS